MVPWNDTRDCRAILPRTRIPAELSTHLWHHVARLRAHDTCQTIANSPGFWKSYLSGIEPAPLLFNYLPASPGSATGPPAVFHTLTIPSPMNKDLTAPSVIVASRILLLHHEAIRVMSHEQLGLDAIRDHVPLQQPSQQHAGAILGRLSLDLTVHLAGHLDFGAGKALGMESMDLRSISAARWVLCGVFAQPRMRSGSDIV